jgi:hypothetical protein
MSKAAAIIFWSAVVSTFLTPMELGDVWWHLKTGQWIWQNGGIPHEDPFSIYPVKNPFVLNSFWLSQLMIFFIQAVSGFYGLIVLKSFIFSSLIFIVLRTLKLYGLMPPLGYIAAIPLLFLATAYDEIRPQSFSFLFFALTLHILERYRANSGEGRLYWLLPPVMLLWGNMHGGYVLGDALIAVYAAWEAAASVKKRSSLRFLFACALSFAFSLINPNGGQAFRMTFRLFSSSVSGSALIHEHLPLKGFSFLTGQEYLFYAALGFMALVFISFLLKAFLRARPDILHLIVFAGLSYATLTSFRAGLFFAMFGAVVLGKNLSAYPPAAAISKGKAFPFLIVLSGVAVIALVIIPRSIVRRPVINESITPVKVSNFILTEMPPGNIYHPYEWGGYLIWRLYPRYRVFIDGRAIGPISEYASVLEARPGWQGILKRKGVNTVLYWPLLPYKGTVPPIVFALLRDDGWSPVYWDLQSIVFIRSGLAKKTISKSAVFELIQSLISARIAKEPQKAANYIELGKIYMEKGMKENAETSFRKALSLEPKNKEAILRLGSLR